LGEAERCLRDLAVPFYHHELVRRSIQKMLADPPKTPILANLLHGLNRTGLLSDTQMILGFTREVERLSDDTLDVPDAPVRFEQIIDTAQRDGWLDPHFSIAAAKTELHARSQTLSPGEVRYKRECDVVAREYFHANDVEEVGRCLAELSDETLRHLFVKRLFSVALDMSNAVRERASLLLPALPTDILPQAVVMSGFEMLLATAEDLALDCPEVRKKNGREIVDNNNDNLLHNA
jgi:hypothetical protein